MPDFLPPPPPPGMYDDPDDQPSYVRRDAARRLPDRAAPAARLPGPTGLHWLLIVIGATAALVIGGYALLGIIFISPVSSPLSGPPAAETPQVAPVEPEAPAVPPAPPTYRCGADCYSVMDAAALAPSSDAPGLLTGLELEDDEEAAASAGLVYDADQEAWLASGATPGECSFARASGAVWVESSADDNARNDFVIDFGTYEDAAGGRQLTQGVRVFDSTPAALQYLGSLESAAAACPTYSTAEGTTMILPADPAPFTGDLSGTGWFAKSGDTETVTTVMQRQNTVVVTRYSSAATPGPGEAGIDSPEFNDFLTESVQRLADLPG